MPDYIYLLENRLSPAQQNALRHVRDAARAAGMTVFLAGGAVRDLTSGFPVRDLDFTVQGNALKLKKSLEKAGAALWGEHEPSRTLFFWFPGGVRVEVSSARREEYPRPGKPVYHWAPILEDLRRRDFTANAMAISLNEGSWGLLLDPLNGFADIETRHLRLASNYGFIEDPARLLRATRLSVRTGWEMEPRTRTRYQTAKDEGFIENISDYARGYELEEIAHEEDPVMVLRAFEAEGWMKTQCPAWSAAKVDLKGLDELNKTLIHLMMLGVNPDPSAAHMELLTARMVPKDITSLKRLFPRHGFVHQWDGLDQSAREFSKELLGKATVTPSATWKVIVNHNPEAVLWLAFSSKNAQVKEKFNNFFNVWPEARQKIPTTLMAEMRITPELPDYGKVAEELFFQFMDGKLNTDEEIRAFLQPYSPPAPPPPVIIRRQRGRRAEPKFEEDEDLDVPAPRTRGSEDGEDEEETEDSANGEEIELLPPTKSAAPVKADAKPSRAPKSEPAKASPAKASPAKSVKEPASVARVAPKSPAHPPAAAKSPAKPQPTPAEKLPARPEPKATAKAKTPEKKSKPEPARKKADAKPHAHAPKAVHKTAAKRPQVVHKAAKPAPKSAPKKAVKPAKHDKKKKR
jgi:hypothetical protein